MSMVISTNMSALNTTNSLNKTTTAMNSSLQKLSSGYSINSAADNSAGLAISEKMRSQIQGLDQASSNSQDATSLTQTADGALDETTSILKRMRELAVEASSETLTDDDRTSVQDETNSLRQQIDRISNDTEYNTKKLLNGDSGSSTAVSGTNSSAINTLATTAGNNTASGTYDVQYTKVATQATSALTTTSNSGITSSSDSASAYAGDVSINGTTVTILSGDLVSGVIDKINAQSETTGVTATLDTSDTNNQFIKLTASAYGSASTITLAADSTTTLNKLFNAVDSTSTATSVTTSGTDAAGTINGAAAVATGNTLKAFDLTVTGSDDSLAKLSVTYTDTALASTLNTINNTASNTANTALTANVAANTTLETALTTASTSAAGVKAKSVFDAAITTATSGTATATKTAVADAYNAYSKALSNGDATDLVTSKATLDTAITALDTANGNTTLATAETAYNTASGTAINTAATSVLSTAATLQATTAAITNSAITTSGATSLSGLISGSTTDLATLSTAITTATGGAASDAKTDVTKSFAAYTKALTSGDASSIVATKTDLDTKIATLADATLTTARGTYDTAAGTAITTAATAIKTALATTSDVNTNYSNYTKAVEAAATDKIATASVVVDSSNALTFQVGANSKQTMTLSIGDTDANSLGVAGNTSTTGIDLSSSTSATSAITVIDAAIKKVSAERSNLGAVQNSLESNINNLDTESENLTSAESNIRDTDMAKEMAEYTKLSVINQAATAMLAKANQQPSKVLSLLQN